MKINLTDDDHDELELEGRFILFSTDKDVFTGGKLSINDIYSSLSALILKSYNIVNNIIKDNYEDFKYDTLDFESFMSELIDSVTYNSYGISIINVDKNELLKQIKQMKIKDIMQDIQDINNKDDEDDEDINYEQ